MKYMPNWTLTHEGRCENLTKRIEERERFERQRLSATWKFKRLLNERFPLKCWVYRYFEDSAVFQCDSLFGPMPGDDSEFGQVILIRAIYVIQSQRNKGVATRLLHKLIEFSDESGCCLFAVSKPFRRLGQSDPHETVVEVADYFTSFESSVFELIGESQYREPQNQMSNTLEGAGFQQISVPELITNQTHCPPQHCWIYIPDTVEPNFMATIRNRLIK